MLVYCKDYHNPKTNDARYAGKRLSGKSKCPPWAMNERLQAELLKESLVCNAGAVDRFGKPRRRWNAVGGYVFVAVSCHTEDGKYNCYPEDPPSGVHYRELLRRRDRTPEQLLKDESQD
jgi:hypothetical protein